MADSGGNGHEVNDKETSTTTDTKIAISNTNTNTNTNPTNTSNVLPSQTSESGSSLSIPQNSQVTTEVPNRIRSSLRRSKSFDFINRSLSGQENLFDNGNMSNHQNLDIPTPHKSRRSSYQLGQQNSTSNTFSSSSEVSTPPLKTTTTTTTKTLSSSSLKITINDSISLNEGYQNIESNHGMKNEKDVKGNKNKEHENEQNQCDRNDITNEGVKTGIKMLQRIKSKKDAQQQSDASDKGKKQNRKSRTSEAINKPDDMGEGYEDFRKTVMKYQRKKKRTIRGFEFDGSEIDNDISSLYKALGPTNDAKDKKPETNELGGKKLTLPLGLQPFGQVPTLIRGVAEGNTPELFFTSKQVTNNLFEFLEENERNYDIASVYIYDALRGYDYRHRTDPLSLKILKAFHSWWYQLLFNVIVFVLFLLAAFEEPAMWRIPFGITQSIELVIILFLTIDLFLKFRVTSKIVWGKANMWNFVTLFIILCTAFDIIIHVASLGRVIRLTRIFRCYFGITRHRTILVTFKHMLFVSRRLIIVIIIILFLTIFYGMIGRLIFYDEQFSTFFESFLNMFICLTTANFPDLMINELKRSMLFSLYFISYLIIGLYFVLNVTIAMVYTYYRDGAKAEVIESYKSQRTALLAAFKCIDRENRGFIDFDQWFTLLKRLRGNTEESQAKALFNMLDMDNNKTLEPIDFLQLCDIWMVQLKKKNNSRINNKYAKYIYDFLKTPLVPSLRKVLKSSTYHKFTTSLIVVSGFMTLYYIFLEVTPIPIWITVLFHTADIIIILISVAEVIAGALSIGILGYLSNYWSVIDCLIVFSTILIKVIGELILEVFIHSTRLPMLSRILQLVYLLRFFRIFTVVRKLRVLAQTFLTISVVIFYFSIVLIIHYYNFAIVGMELFSGQINDSNRELDGSDYRKSGYDRFVTFNHIGNAFFTLFHLMVVNNWHITARGHMIVFGEWSILYFLVFYFFTVTITLNTLVAFVVETFFVKFEENKQFQNEMEDKIDDSCNGNESNGKIKKNNSDELQDMNGECAKSNTAGDQNGMQETLVVNEEEWEVTETLISNSTKLMDKVFKPEESVDVVKEAEKSLNMYQSGAALRTSNKSKK